MSDLFEEFLYCHLPLGHLDDVPHDALVSLQVHEPHLHTQVSAQLAQDERSPGPFIYRELSYITRNSSRNAPINADLACCKIFLKHAKY